MENPLFHCLGTANKLYRYKPRVIFSEMAECRLFQKTFKRLHDCIQTDVENFTLKLYSSAIVGKGVRDEVYSNVTTPSQATAKLLSAVESKIETNAAYFGEFVEVLGANPPWTEVADDLRKELFLIQSPQVRPELESGSHTLKTRSSEPCLPTTVAPPLPLHSMSNPAPVIHIEKLVVTPGLGPIPDCVDPVRATPASQPPEEPVMPPVAKSLVQSPLSNQGSDLVSEERTTTASCTSTLMEQGDQSLRRSSAMLSLHSQSSSISSQSSVCSVTEEEIQSVRESVMTLLTKVQHMEQKLKKKDKKLNAMKQEQAKERKTYEDGMAVANRENKELHERLQSLQLHSKELEDELTVANEAMRESDRQKQYLLSQLTEHHTNILQYQERCQKLEAQVKEANAGIDFHAAYQKSEVKVQELESEVEHLKATNLDYTKRIELLEWEIDVLVCAEPSNGVESSSDLLDEL